MPDTLDPVDKALERLALNGDPKAQEILASDRAATVRTHLYNRQMRARREGRRFHPAEAELAVSQAAAATPASFLDLPDQGEIAASQQEGSERGVVGGAVGAARRMALPIVRARPQFVKEYGAVLPSFMDNAIPGEDISANDVRTHAAKRLALEGEAEAKQGFAAKLGSAGVAAGKLGLMMHPATALPGAVAVLGADIAIPTANQMADAANARGDTDAFKVAAEAALVAGGRGGAMLGGIGLGSKVAGAVLPTPLAAGSMSRVLGSAAYGAAEAVPQVAAMTAFGAPVEALAPEGVGASLEDQVRGVPGALAEFVPVNALMRGAPALLAYGGARAIRKAGAAKAAATPEYAREAYRSMQEPYGGPTMTRAEAPVALGRRRLAEGENQAAFDAQQEAEARDYRRADIRDLRAKRANAAAIDEWLRPVQEARDVDAPEPAQPSPIERRIREVTDEADIAADPSREAAIREGYGEFPGEPVGPRERPEDALAGSTSALAAKRAKPRPPSTPRQVVDAEEAARRQAEIDRQKAVTDVAAEGEAARMARIAAEEEAAAEKTRQDEEGRIAALRKRAFSPAIRAPKLEAPPVDDGEVAQVIDDRVRQRFADSKMNADDPDVRHLPLLDKKRTERINELAARGDANARAYVEMVRQFHDEHGGDPQGLAKLRRVEFGARIGEALKAGERARAVGPTEAAKLFADLSRIPGETRAEYAARAKEMHQFEQRRAFESAVEAERSRRADAAAARAELEDLVRSRRAAEMRRGKMAKAKNAAVPEPTLEAGREPPAETPEPAESPAEALRQARESLAKESHDTSAPAPETQVEGEGKVRPALPRVEGGGEGRGAEAPPATSELRGSEGLGKEGAAGPAEGSRGGDRVPDAEVNPHALHRATEKERADKAMHDVRVAEAVAKGHDVARAEADAEFARAKATSDEAIAKANVKGATAADKKAAVEAAKEHVEVAARRVDVSSAKVEALTAASDGSDAAKEAIEVAKDHLATAQADHNEARAVLAKSKVTTADLKATAAKATLEARKERQMRVAEELRPTIEAGIRKASGEKLSVVTTPDGHLQVNNEKGEKILPIQLNLEKKAVEDVNWESWWNTMGGEKGVADKLAENRGKNPLVKLVGKTRPKTVEEMISKLSPKERDRLLELHPIEGGYSVKTRSITLYDVENLKNAMDVGFHEMNHDDIYKMFRLMAQGNSEAQKHLDTLAKVTGIDPREKGKLGPFMEEVTRRYIAWSKSAGVRATAAAKSKAAPSLLDKAFKWVDRMRELIRAALGMAPKGSVVPLTEGDVFEKLREGEYSGKTVSPEAPTAAEDAGELASVGRRALRAHEDDPNLAMRAADKEGRGIEEQIRKKYARPDRRIGWQEQEKLADDYEKGLGGEKAAIGKILADREAAAAEGRIVPENHLESILLGRAIRKTIDQYTRSGVFHGDKLNKLYLADTEHREDVAREMQSYRDRLQSPAERVEAVYRAFYQPSPEMRKAMSKARRAIAKAKANGDPAAEARAAKVYDELQSRHIRLRDAAIERMKEFGIDLTDGKTLHEWLSDDENYSVVMSNIEQVQKAALGGVSVPDWVVANFKAHLLGNPLVTQTQQLASNALGIASGLSRETLRNPHAVIATFRAGAIRSAVMNAAESMKLGKNAWVDKITGEELGRTEDYKNPTDVYSRVNRALSFNIMAALDGGAQRFNASLEATTMVYRDLRSKGISRAEAMQRATDMTSDLHGDLAVEAMFRSLPSTWQELGLRREGVTQDEIDPLDRAVGHAGAFLANVFDRIPSGFKDPETGKMVNVPLSKLILPFARTMMAIARSAVRHSVFGTAEAVQTARKAMGPEADAWTVEEAKRRAYESLVVGVVAMHGLALLLDATGTEVDDPSAAYTGRTKGEKTINLFGKRIGYSRLEPFATPLAAAANGLKAIREGRYGDIATDELAALVHMGSDLAWFRLISSAGDTIGAVKRDDKTGMEAVKSGIGKWVGSTAVAATPILGQASVRAGIRAATSDTEDVVKQDKEKGFLSAAFGEGKKAVGMGKETPVLDVWGRQVHRGPFEGGGAAQTAVEMAIGGAMGKSPAYVPTDVDTWAENAGYKIPRWMPEYPKHSGLKGTMKGDDLNAFIEIAGPKFLERMRAFKDSRPDATAEEIKKAVGRMHEIIGRQAGRRWMESRQSTP